MATLHISFRLLFISAFFIYGIHYCLMHDNILGFIRKFLYKLRSEFAQTEWTTREKVLQFLFQPIMDCVICMASVWGTALYVLFTPFHFTSDYFITWVVAVVSLAGLNRLLKSMI